MYCMSPIDKILLIGNGGHCKVVIDALYRYNPKIKIGLITEKVDPSPLFVGVDADLPKLHEEGWKMAFVAIGSIGDCSLRVKIAHSLQQLGFVCPPIIDPTAIVSASANIGNGVFIGAGAVINANAHIDQYAIVNTRSVIEHDCTIGMFSHVSPGAILCGNVSIGKHVHVGAGSLVRQSIHIGDDTVVGMGSVIVKDLPNGCIAYGAPCKIQKYDK